MDLSSILLISFALAMDAFAVALSTGAYLKKASRRQTFRLAFHFGLFQFFMPLIGWVAGMQVIRIISEYDHWIAWLLLCIIGGKMIHEALTGSDEHTKSDMTKGGSLVMLSIATSIDALAVGLSLAVVGVGIFFPSIIIGCVAALMTIFGLRLGERFSQRLGKKMELIGGVVLILIGFKILIEHL
jgi:manganese efflux pump family protein